MEIESLKEELEAKREILEELEELKYATSRPLNPFTSHRVTDRIGELIVRCSELSEQIERLQKKLEEVEKVLGEV